MFTQLGAAPVTIPLKELYTALQTHLADAQENSLVSIEAAKVYEVQKYCSITNHIWNGLWIFGSAQNINNLPDDLKTILFARMDEAGLNQRAEMAALAKSLTSKFEGDGMVFNYPKQDTFKDKLRSTGFYVDWKTKIGEETWALLERYHRTDRLSVAASRSEAAPGKAEDSPPRISARPRRGRPRSRPAGQSRPWSARRAGRNHGGGGRIPRHLRGNDSVPRPTIAITEDFLKSFSALEIVANFGVGYEHIDAAAAGRLGIIVTHTPNILTEEVADTAMGLLLSTVRRLPQADRYVRAGKWLEDHYPLSASLRGRKLGMLGLGRIGKAIARRAEAFGLEINYHTRNRQPDQPYRYHASLLEMAKAVDILLISVPGGPETRGIVDAEVLAALGPDGILINMGRGTVVDEPALIAALHNKTILSAGLDVFPNEPHVAPELLAMDDIVLFPHVGSGSFYARHGMSQLAADNLLHWFAGKGPLTPVPETPYRQR